MLWDDGAGLGNWTFSSFLSLLIVMPLAESGVWDCEERRIVEEACIAILKIKDLEGMAWCLVASRSERRKPDSMRSKKETDRTEPSATPEASLA